MAVYNEVNEEQLCEVHKETASEVINTLYRYYIHA